MPAPVANGTTSTRTRRLLRVARIGAAIIGGATVVAGEVWALAGDRAECTTSACQPVRTASLLCLALSGLALTIAMNARRGAPTRWLGGGAMGGALVVGAAGLAATWGADAPLMGIIRNWSLLDPGLSSSALGLSLLALSIALLDTLLARPSFRHAGAPKPERILDESSHPASQQLAAVLEASIDGVLLADGEGRVVELNEEAERLLGQPADNAVGRDLSELVRSPASEEPVAIERLSAIGRLQIETVRADGSVCTVELSVAPSGDGEQAGYAIILHDLRDRQNAQGAQARADELEETCRRIAESSRRKTDFVAAVSHELRTPLNSIIGFGELLQDGVIAPASPEYWGAVADTLASARHVQQIVDDVLDLSQIEAGKMEFHPEPVEIGAVVRELMATLAPLAISRGVALRAEVAERLQAVQLDPVRFRQVLYNYLSNALKYTPAGGVATLRVTEDGDRLRVEVEDTGAGIRNADLPSLFSEFNRLRPAGNTRVEGTGLGLALTRRLVEAQGGSVGARSTLGVGSVFWASLPLRPAEAHP